VKGVQPERVPAVSVTDLGGLAPGEEGKCSTLSPSLPCLHNAALPSNEARAKDLKRKLFAAKAKYELPKLPPGVPSRGLTFKVHKATRSLGQTVFNMIKEAFPEGTGTKLIGLQEDLEGLILVGDYPKYQRILHAANKLFSLPELSNEAFAFTSIALLKGAELEDLPTKEAFGAKRLWLWASKGAVAVQLGRSRFHDLHSAILSWDGDDRLRMRTNGGEVIGVLWYRWNPDLLPRGRTAEDLVAAGYNPAPGAFPEVVATT
jgi:hypothetical protein